MYSYVGISGSKIMNVLKIKILGDTIPDIIRFLFALAVGAFLFFLGFMAMLGPDWLWEKWMKMARWFNDFFKDK